MAANEVNARQQDNLFMYLSEETSPRTGGHLWREKVVETDDGPLRRLLAVDGKPLDPAQSKAESDRIQQILADPDSFRRENAARKDDEVHATRLLVLLPKAFIVTPNGEQNGCSRYAFRPNPSFQPSTYEERVAHAMTGTVSIQEPAERLCTLEGTIMQPVEFGFGILGRVEQGGHFMLQRIPVDAGRWKTDRISVHVQGRVLMLKTLTRNQEVTRSHIAVVTPHLSLTDAARLTLP